MACRPITKTLDKDILTNFSFQGALEGEKSTQLMQELRQNMERVVEALSFEKKTDLLVNWSSVSITQADESS